FSESASELDISGRVVNRIASKNNEQLHFALIRFVDELPELINLISKLRRSQWFADTYWFIAKLTIDVGYKLADFRRLGLAGNCNARSAICSQVIGRGLNPWFILGVPIRDIARALARSDTRCHLLGNREHIARRCCNAMIGI